jgi:predicted protein tyrosine phosphatase
LITLSNAEWAASAVAGMEAEYLVSLMSAEEMGGTPSDIDPANHLKLEVDDIEFPQSGHICPCEEHVHRLLEFGELFDGGTEVVVHCLMGMSRSVAAVMILLAQNNPGREFEIAEVVFRKSPTARPNKLLLQLGDRILGCNGALVGSVQSRPSPGPNSQSIYSGAFGGFTSFPLYINGA